MKTRILASFLLLSICAPAAIATQAGHIVAWGVNEDGQTQAPAGDDFVAIAAGEAHGLALRANGSIVGWGWDYFGQATPPSGTGFIAVAAGCYHSLALRTDGSIVGWGNNYSNNGQWLGQATPPSGTGYKAIGAGYQHSVALRADGSIVAWGDNKYGQATAPSGTGYVAVAAGIDHCLALKSDGKIVGWGRNTDYDDNFVWQAKSPIGKDFVAIAAGGFHSIALKADGSIVGWGLNDWGQTNTPSGTDFVAIAAGLYHNLAIKTDGRCIVWGHNSSTKNKPPSRTDFMAIAGGWHYSLAIVADIVAPSPNPMTWSISPYPLSQASVTMTATTANDESGVEYYFTCTSNNGGHDSGWQSQATYIDTGLQQGVVYTYRVKARDRSTRHNETADSAEASTMIPLLPPEKALNPSPLDGAINIANSVVLRWSGDANAAKYDVYLGKSPVLGPQNLIRANITEPSSNSGLLGFETMYYWRVDSKNVCGTTAGDVWSFSTGTNPYPIITGHITTGAGVPVIGVTMVTSDGRYCSAGTGEYVIVFTYGWSGTITPSRNGYQFTPASRSYENVTASQYNQDFIAELIPVTLDSVMPAEGTAGTIVTLDGNNLGEVPGRVLFAGTEGKIIEWTTTSITCFVPIGASTGEVVVERSDLRVSNGVKFVVIAADVLYVNSHADEGFQYGTRQYPFKTIWKAVTAADDGTIIEVDDGIYTGPKNRGLDTLGKAITLRSANGPASCIIDCNGLDRGIFIHRGEGVETVIDGFTIINGCDGGTEATVYGGGVAVIGSSPTIRNCVIQDCSGIVGGAYFESGSPRMTGCIIRDNQSPEGIGGVYCCYASPVFRNTIITHNHGAIGGIYANDSALTIINCTIADNTGMYDMGGGVMCDMCDDVSMLNTILWNNLPCELLFWESAASARFSCIKGGLTGEGNISKDPLFVDSDNGDCHLRAGSPCIDAGDPNSDFGNEPWPNGGRINIGAYGNTAEATKSTEVPLSATYQVIGKRRVGRTQYDYVCRVVLKNNSQQGVRVMQFELLSVPANLSIIDGSVSEFRDITAGGSATSEDTCTFRVDRSAAIDSPRVTWRANYVVIGSSQAMECTSSSVLDLESKVMGDISGNGVVDMADLSILAEQWLDTPGMPSADIAPEPSGDGAVNFLDFAAVAGSWMEDNGLPQ